MKRQDANDELLPPQLIPTYFLTYHYKYKVVSFFGHCARFRNGVSDSWNKIQPIFHLCGCGVYLVKVGGPIMPFAQPCTTRGPTARLSDGGSRSYDFATAQHVQPVGALQVHLGSCNIGGQVTKLRQGKEKGLSLYLQRRHHHSVRLLCISCPFSCGPTTIPSSTL